MSMPDTIRNPERFLEAGAAGFDGVFDWSWTHGCFGGKITPMDFDGVVERKGNFIIFETKDLNAPIPKGQLITLESAHKLGCITIMLIHGKDKPERGEIWYPGGDIKKEFSGVDEAKALVGRWYEYANKNPTNANVDIGFLQRSVLSIQAERDELKKKIEMIADELQKLIHTIRD